MTSSALADSVNQEIEQLLLRRLERDPGNRSVRLKLIELEFEMGRTETFAQYARDLARLHGERDPEWGRVATMGRMLGLDDPIFRMRDDAPIEFVESSPRTGSKQHRRFGDSEDGKRYFGRLHEAWSQRLGDADFVADFDKLIQDLCVRLSPLYHARRLSQTLGGAQIYIKRDDLSPPHSRLLLNLFGQALVGHELGRKVLVMGCRRARLGVVAASVASRMNMPLQLLMTREDMDSSADDLFAIRAMGAQIKRITGEGADFDIRAAALAHCAAKPDGTMLLLGLDSAPPPYPSLGRDFTTYIGREMRRQMRDHGFAAPDLIAARAGDHADAIGLFEPFLATPGTRLALIEGKSDLVTRKSRANSQQDPWDDRMDVSQQIIAGRILDGLEYPSVAREMAYLQASGRVEHFSGGSDAARDAVHRCAREEGLMLPVETAYAIGWAMEQAEAMPPEQTVVVMLAERSGKDLPTLRRALES